MSIKLYIDENAIRKAFVNELRSRGIDVATTKEQNTDGYSDPEQLKFAYGLKRVLFTYNIHDFEFLHNQYITEGKYHAGIIFANQLKFDRLKYTRALLNLINNKTAEEMENTIEFLDHWF